MKVIIAGAAGRMGRALVEAADEAPQVEIAGIFEFKGNAAAGEKIGSATLVDDPSALWGSTDALIEFTTPEATLAHLDEAVAAGLKVVIGTTGMDAAGIEKIKQAAEKVPICFAPNFSVGINLLINLISQAARTLGDDYDVEVIEAHHRHKKDAPSGTAIRLAEALADALDRNLEENAVYERKGIIGERPAKEIGIQTLRGGDIVGEHTIMFAGIGERLELTHRASSRQTFARGAVRAAQWLEDKAPGLYDMQDVLGLKG
jgi:4-hydroxy-tetrahydrodipicolinate reductase